MADSSGITREMFLTWIEAECGRSLMFIRALREADLDICVAPGAMTAGTMANHMIGSLYWLDRVASHDDVNNDYFQTQFPATDGAGLGTHYATVLAELMKGLKSLSDARFARKVAVFGMEYELPRLILDLMGHETHHRGQLGHALRAAGQTPPAIYS